MKFAIPVLALGFPFMALAGGGGAPDCDSATILRCQSVDGRTLVDFTTTSCEDGSFDWSYYGLVINAPSGLYTVREVELINRTYHVSSAISKKKYALETKGAKPVWTAIELKVDENLRGNISVSAPEVKREILNAEIICRN